MSTKSTTRSILAPIAQGIVDAVAISLAISGMAFAAPAPTPLPFESLDRNTDERLSRSEASYNRLLADIFAASDVDGDGFVDRIEYAQAISSAPSGQPAPRTILASD